MINNKETSNMDVSICLMNTEKEYGIKGFQHIRLRLRSATEETGR
jgi:hypothetical protein